MRKITKCTGEGHGSCTRCTENGKLVKEAKENDT